MQRQAERRACSALGWLSMATKRRIRRPLVPRSGVECYEVRAVTYIDEDGQLETEVEITLPDPDSDDYPSRMSVLGSHREAELKIVGMYEDEDG